MSNLANQFVSPVGRLVQGNPLEKQTKDQQGNLLTIKSGPNMGQPTQRYFCAIAFHKQDPLFAPFYAQMVAVARAAWPQHFDAAGNCTHPRFSWKLSDGDGIDDNGKPNNTKEGFAGHWVVKFSSSYEPRCVYPGRYSPQDYITDPKLIVRGWYGRVSGSMEGNGNVQKPGLYMNLNSFELCAQGVEIVSGPDVGAVFGGSPVAALPAGAIALPAGGAPMTAPAGIARPASMPGAAMPGMGAQPGAVAQQAVQPNPGFVNGPGAPMPGMLAGAAMPAARIYTMTAAAKGYTREQYHVQKWTDEMLIAQGMMTVS